MVALRVKGWILRRRLTIDYYLKHDFIIGNWDFMWNISNNYDSSGTQYVRKLYITGGFLGETTMPVNNPFQLVTAIVNHTKVTVDCGERADRIKIIFSKRMILTANIAHYELQCKNTNYQNEAEHDYDTDVPED